MVPNRMTTVSSPKPKAKGQVHKYFVDMVKGVLLGLGNDDYLSGLILAIHLSADVAADDHESGDTASSSAGSFSSGFSGSSAASGMVAQ